MVAEAAKITRFGQDRQRDDRADARQALQLRVVGVVAQHRQRALRHGGDFADLYVERRDGFTLSLDQRRVERAQTGSETGAAIRVVVGDATYFGHVDGLAERDLERLADEVGSAVRGSSTAPRPAT